MGLSDHPGAVRPSQAFQCAAQGQGWLQIAPFDSFFFSIETGMLLLRRLSQQLRSRVRLKFRMRATKSFELPLMWFGRGAAKGWVRLQCFLPQ